MAMSRRKGHSYERRIRNRFRRAYDFLDPETIQRSQQGRHAEESDVKGVPGLWIECQDSRFPNPKVKLMQAERDVVAARLLNQRIPIAVCHLTGAKYRDDTVTLRLKHLMVLGMQNNTLMTLDGPNPMVTMRLDEFMEIAKAWVKQHEEHTS